MVGISSIIVNLGKVREMCRMTRELAPHSTIVVGGHVAAIPGIETMIDADHIVRGEGVSWMRRYLGEDENATIRHPAIVSGMRTRIMGIRQPERKGATGATIIPSVGCPMGCNFCTTSAFFGGKGKFVNFFESGDELFEVMNRMEAELEVHSFFVMDENFLLHRERALRLLERMKEERKSCALSVFASANAIRKYTCRNWWNWACRGCGWVWNLRGPVTASCKARTSGNSPANCGNTEYACRGQPSSGWSITHPTTLWGKSSTRFRTTPTSTSSCFIRRYRELRCISRWQKRDAYCAVWTMLTSMGSSNSISATISRDDSKRFLDWAFWRDFQLNGPYRISRTLMAGWQRCKDWPDARLRERFAREMGRLSSIYSSALWAMEHQFRRVNRNVGGQIHALRREFKQESGVMARMLPIVLGPVLLWRTRREEKRLARGKTYEPPTILERSNWIEA